MRPFDKRHRTLVWTFARPSSSTNNTQQQIHVAVQKWHSSSQLVPIMYKVPTARLRRCDETNMPFLTDLVQIRAILEDVLVSSLERSLLPIHSAIGPSEREERNAWAVCGIVRRKMVQNETAHQRHRIARHRLVWRPWIIWVLELYRESTKTCRLC